MSDNYKSDCKYSEQTISHLYGEIDEPGDFRFKRHLENCVACAEEVENFTLIRESIGWWKQKEFDLLETPKIELTARRTGTSAKYRPGSIKKWLANVGKSLAPSSVFAAGLMFVLISSGLIIFTGKFTNDVERAANDTENLPAAIDRPTVSETGDNKIPEEKVEITAPVSTRNRRADDNKLSELETGATSLTRPTSEAAAPETLRASKSKNKRPSAGNERSRNAGFNNLKTIAVNRTTDGKLKNLKLNQIDEDEEKSLRLTDLLDAVGEQ